MIFRRSILTLMASAMVITAAPAKAGARALISLHDGGQPTWDQRDSLQTSLRERFGFDETRFLVDATPDEVPWAVKRFLEEPADETDHRLVWVSGLARRNGASICPPPDFVPARPKAPTLILAPACYGDAILFPQGARHFGISVPVASATIARTGRTSAGDAPWIAYIALPSDGARFVRGADALIAEHLARGAGATLDAAALLQVLRAGFRWNGSSYTPSLDVFDRGLERDELYPFALENRDFDAWRGRLGRRAQARTGHLALYGKPAVKGGPALVLDGGAPVRVLRRGRDGAMRYVVAGRRHFGWVRTDDLAF